MGSNMSKIFLILLGLLFIGHLSYGSPSNTITIPNSFSPSTVIQSSQTNANNNEISSKYNAHSHTDITQLGTVTTGTWNGTAVGTQYGGTGKDWSGVASGALVYFNGIGTLTTLTKPASGSILYLNGLTQQWDTIAQGSNGQLLKSNGASANPSFVSAGKVVQVVNTQTGAVSTGTTVIPYDDTIPQNNEGDQYMTLAIIPTSTSNKLKIDVVCHLANSAGSNLVAVLFQDTTADALAASIQWGVSANTIQEISFSYYMTAGTTSSTTFKVRGGDGAAGTTTFNGVSGGRELGGVLTSSITITEYLPN